MKVYEVIEDFDIYQEFTFDSKKYDLDEIRFSGDVKANWKCPPNLYVENPMAEKGFFTGINGVLSAFMVRKNDLNIINSFLPPETQELKVVIDEEEFCLLNITYKVECLDYEKCIYLSVTDDIHDVWRSFDVEKYVFDTAKFTEHSLFRLKIKAYNDSVGLYCYEGVKDNPEEEFKYFVEKNNLKGIDFRLLWDSENE